MTCPDADADGSNKADGSNNEDRPDDADNQPHRAAASSRARKLLEMLETFRRNRSPLRGSHQRLSKESLSGLDFISVRNSVLR